MVSRRLPHGWVARRRRETVGRYAGGVRGEGLRRKCGGNTAASAPGQDSVAAPAVLHGLRAAPRPLAGSGGDDCLGGLADKNVNNGGGGWGLEPPYPSIFCC